MGMIALILTLLFCAYLVATGSPNVAGGVAVGLIAAVVGIFVIGRKVNTSDDDATSPEDETP